VSTLDLPDTAIVGDPDHDVDHNKIVTALSTLNAEKLDPTIFDAKGDTVAASAADTPVRVPAPTVNGQVYTANSALAPGVGWSGQLLRYQYYWSTASLTWSNMPAADTLFNAYVGPITRFSLAGYSRARLHFAVGTIGFAGAKLMLRYSSAYSQTVGSFVTMGTSEIQATVDVSGYRDSGWVDLVAGAKADVWVAVVGTLGNGVADPTFPMPVVIEFS
jgi:hypothetical protein